MIKIKIFIIVLAFSFASSSCFLFKPTHERCPAYGMDDIHNSEFDHQNKLVITPSKKA